MLLKMSRIISHWIKQEHFAALFLSEAHGANTLRVIMLIRWCLADIHFPALAILSCIQLSLKEKSETDPLKLLFRLTHGDKWKATTLLSAFSRVLNWSQSQCNPGNCIWEHIICPVCSSLAWSIFILLLSLSSLVTPNTLFNSSPAD